MNSTKTQYKVEVDSALCKACGYCVALCRQKALAAGGRLNAQGYFYIEPVDDARCVGCLVCVSVCPDFAIRVETPAA